MTATQTVHATAVSLAGRAVLLQGRSGSGKSALALELMAYGADLIADDQVILTRAGDSVVASCPASLSGLIEARGLGLLRAGPAEPAPLCCVVDLAARETDRLPPRRHVTLLGCQLPLLHRPAGVNLAPALLQFLRWGWGDA